MKKKVIIITILLLVILVLIPIVFNAVHTNSCKKTKIPSGLSAEDTVKLYFKYWDEGNINGMNQLFCVPIYKNSNAFDFETYLCKIKLIDCTDLSQEYTEKAFSKYYDYAIIRTHFKYHHFLRFGDESFSGEYTNWDFYLIKKEKTSNWIIKSWGQC